MTCMECSRLHAAKRIVRAPALPIPGARSAALRASVTCAAKSKKSQRPVQQQRETVTSQPEAPAAPPDAPAAPQAPNAAASGSGVTPLAASTAPPQAATPSPPAPADAAGMPALPPTPTPVTPKPTQSATSGTTMGDSDVGFFQSDLPKKLAMLLGFVAFSRLGAYVRLPGVDVDAFAANVQGSGLLGYLDSLSGGSISNVGVFTLGIIPAINASIFLQVLSAAYPGLKKLQREEGPQGRARYSLYTKLATLFFAVAQAFGALTVLKPYVADYGPAWLIPNVASLVAGAMILTQVGETISELKLGNGTSILIFANIASSLPTSVGAAFTQAGDDGSLNIALYFLAFAVTTLGIVYVQGAERKIPINYAGRYMTTGNLARQSYLPFKVNATGVMPVIFSTSLLAIPSGLARFTNAEWLIPVAQAAAPGGPLYLPTNIALIVAFNYYYTFLQLDPNDLADQLKRQGASIPSVRPGRATAEYVTTTLARMSVLGSGFLGVLAAGPALVEAVTHLTSFRGFGATSVLILVGVATDTVRRIRAEQAMARYKDIDKLYDDLKNI